MTDELIGELARRRLIMRNLGHHMIWYDVEEAKVEEARIRDELKAKKCCSE